MKIRSFVPFFIGSFIGLLLFYLLQWWAFLIIFPWIGLSITTGIIISYYLKGEKKITGRKITLLMVFPCLFLFVPLINNENFQLGGVLLIVLVGFFSKGFIHYAIAKIFGPLIWRRGYCGWACWTAAVLEWLPIKHQKTVDPKLKKIRFLTLLISAAIPVYLVFVLNYDVRNNYLWKNTELAWMFVGNGIYYAVGIPLAFILKNKRAFCKVACPVALVMIPSASVGLIKLKPSGNECIECKKCNKVCPMDIDVMSYISNNKPITHSECILCDDCKVVCPQHAIR